MNLKTLFIYLFIHSFIHYRNIFFYKKKPRINIKKILFNIKKKSKYSKNKVL